MDLNLLREKWGDDKLFSILEASGEAVPAECFRFVWYSLDWGKEIEAYVFSFWFTEKKDARTIALVCKRWYECYKSKTFWRRYMEWRLFTTWAPWKFRRELLPFVDPFHHELWSRGLSFVVNSRIHISPRYATLTFIYGSLGLNFALKTDGSTAISCGTGTVDTTLNWIMFKGTLIRYTNDGEIITEIGPRYQETHYTLLSFDKPGWSVEKSGPNEDFVLKSLPESHKRPVRCEGTMRDDTLEYTGHGYYFPDLYEFLPYGKGTICDVESGVSKDIYSDPVHAFFRQARRKLDAKKKEKCGSP